MDKSKSLMITSALLFITLCFAVSAEAQLVWSSSSSPKHANSVVQGTSDDGVVVQVQEQHWSGGCRRPNSEIVTAPFASSSSSTLQKVAICKHSKPIKPSRVIDMSKALCGTNWAICSHLERGVGGLAWGRVGEGPEGCFGFKYGEKGKATGYGSRCHHVLYYDGILCCPIDKHQHKKKKSGGHHLNKKSRHHLLTNDIH